MWTRVPKRAAAQPSMIFAPIIDALFDTSPVVADTDSKTDADADDDAVDDDDNNEQNDDSSKPRVIWRAWWTRYGIPTRAPRASGVHVLDDVRYVCHHACVCMYAHELFSGEIDYDSAVRNVERVFASLCPGVEFIEKIPDPEDIVWQTGNAEGTTDVSKTTDASVTSTTTATSDASAAATTTTTSDVSAPTQEQQQ